MHGHQHEFALYAEVRMRRLFGKSVLVVGCHVLSASAYSEDAGAQSPCGFDQTYGQDIGDTIKPGHPVCAQVCPNTEAVQDHLDMGGYELPATLFDFTGTDRHMCMKNDDGCQRRSHASDMHGLGCAGICGPAQTGGSQGACFTSTTQIPQSIVKDGCGPDNHGSAYPINGHANSFSTPDNTLFFYGQNDTRVPYARVYPETAPTSFTNAEIPGSSAFIQPDTVSVSDNTRESHTTKTCKDHVDMSTPNRKSSRLHFNAQHNYQTTAKEASVGFMNSLFYSQKCL